MTQKEISDFKCLVIIPAAGIGRRMGQSKPKQYLPILNLSMIEHTLNSFISLSWIDKIFVAIAENDTDWSQLTISKHPKIETVIGGTDRVHSVQNALNALQKFAKNNDYIFVHDAARPCIHSDDLEQLYVEMQHSDSGVILADKISDTLKRSAFLQQNEGLPQILETVPRENMWRALTPQVFQNKLLKDAFAYVEQHQCDTITDEASAIEAFGYLPKLLQGRPDNIKITEPQDRILACSILQNRFETES